MKNLTNFINESLSIMIVESLNSKKLKQFLTELKEDSNQTNLYYTLSGIKEGYSSWIRFIKVGSCGNGKFSFDKKIGHYIKISDVTDDDFDIIDNENESIGKSLVEYFDSNKNSKSFEDDFMLVAINDNKFNKIIIDKGRALYGDRDLIDATFSYVGNGDSDSKDPYFKCGTYKLESDELDLNKVNIYKGLVFGKEFIEKNKKFIEDVWKKTQKQFSDKLNNKENQ